MRRIQASFNQEYPGGGEGGHPKSEREHQPATLGSVENTEGLSWCQGVHGRNRRVDRREWRLEPG